MRRTIILFFLLIVTLGTFAQESELEKKQREYRFATTEESPHGFSLPAYC